MALGPATKTLLCLLVVYCCTAVTEGEQLIDCCTKVGDKHIDKRLVKDYRHQVAGQGCDRDATIFMTRRNKALCAPPNETWVHELMKHVDALKIKCTNNNYKGKACHGLKSN